MNYWFLNVYFAQILLIFCFNLGYEFSGDVCSHKIYVIAEKAQKNWTTETTSEEVRCI